MIQSRAIGLVMAPNLSPISRIWFFPYGVCQLARGSFCVHAAIAYSNSFGIDDGIITSEIIPAIQRVAEVQNLTVIDLHTALRGYGDLFLDGVHPGLEGNRVIATIIYDVLAKEYSLNK